MDGQIVISTKKLDIPQSATVCTN